MTTAITVKQLNKTFGKKQVLHSLDLDVPKGAMVALIGASCSGKSTLLRHLAGLERSDKKQGGELFALGQQVQANGVLSKKVRHIRSDIGYIFQQFNLVGRLSVLQNVLLGRLGRIPRWRGTLSLFSQEDKDLAYAALERVGLLEHAFKRASQLSGGQQQRVAIARTLCQQAEIILADEPIASLDPESARKVMDTLADINQKDGKTVIVTLHQVDYAVRYCRDVVALKDGVIHYQGSIKGLTNHFLNGLYGSELGTNLLFGDTHAEPQSEKKPTDKEGDVLVMVA